MGGPILKKLADSATLAASGTVEHYFTAGERKGPVRVWLRFDKTDAGGNPNLELTVLPVFPSLNGTATVAWPAWTASTLPNVVPDNGVHALGGAASSGEGCVFISSEARVSQFKATVVESAGEPATYTLVAELL